jgi:hypothetical protein
VGTEQTPGDIRTRAFFVPHAARVSRTYGGLDSNHQIQVTNLIVADLFCAGDCTALFRGCT